MTSTTASAKTGRLLGVLFLGVLMAAMDIAIVAPALPAIRDALRITDRAVSWVFTAYLLLNLIGTPIMAKLADRTSRRAVYVLDVLLFAAGTLVAGTAAGLPQLLLGRALQGLGSGGLFPIAAAVIGDVVPPEKRGRTLGLIGGTFGLAFLVGPILGGILLRVGDLMLNAHGWRLIFWAVVPMAAVLAPAAWRTLPAGASDDDRPFDLVGAVLLSLALVSLAFGLNQLEVADGWRTLTAARVGPFLLIGVGLWPLLWVWERRVADPVFPVRALRTLRAWLAMVLTFGAGFLEGGLMFVPALLVAALGVDKHTASFMMVPLALALGVGAPLFGRLLDARGPRLVLLTGTLLATVGLGIIGWAPVTFVTFYLAGGLAGLGLSALLGAPIRYIMIQEAPADERASAQAVISLVTKIGQLLAGAIVGAVATSFGGGAGGYIAAYRVEMLLAAGLVLVAANVRSTATAARDAASA